MKVGSAKRPRRSPRYLEPSPFKGRFFLLVAAVDFMQLVLRSHSPSSSAARLKE
jgi:hypothetical protein